MIEMFFLLLLLLFILICSGYFSSSEVAFFSLTPLQIKAYRRDGDPKKKLIAKLLLQPRDLLVTIFLMNTLVNILLQNVASDLVAGYAGWGLKVGAPLILTLIFGEIIPKNIGLMHNAALAYRTVSLINAIQRLVSPLRRLIIAVTTPVSRLLFFYLKKASEISHEELKHALQSSHQRGILTGDEMELVHGYLNLQEATIKEAMRPKEEILYYKIDEPLTKLVHFFVDQQCSQIPVCKEDLQQVLGVVTAKQYFLNRHKIKGPQDLKRILQKPYFVPEGTPAKLLLKRFSEHGEKFALVVDEYGIIEGLVTHEDLAELVVGEILDRRDQEELYTRSGKYEIIADARMELHDLEEIFAIEFKSKSGMVTLGGWLIEQIGALPKSGTKYETKGLLFQILSADPNKVRRVYIRRKKT